MNLTIVRDDKGVPKCVHTTEAPCKHYQPSEVRKFRGTCVNRGLTSGACMIAPMKVAK